MTNSNTPITPIDSDEGTRRIEELLNKLSITEVGTTHLGEIVWSVTALQYEIDDAQWEGNKPGLVEVLEWRLILLANNILEETQNETSPVSLARRSQLNSLYQAVLEDLVLAYHHRP